LNRGGSTAAITQDSYRRNLHGTIVTYVVVKRFPGVLEKAFGQAAADLVGRGPDHLGVVPYNAQLVLATAVSEVVLLQVPSFDGEQPSRKNYWVMDFSSDSRVPWNFVGRYEDVLAAGAVIVDVSPCDVVVGQNETLSGPLLGRCRRPPVPPLRNIDQKNSHQSVDPPFATCWQLSVPL
jgi:hypothetical protein